MNYPEAARTLCALLRDGQEAAPNGETVDSLIVGLLGERNTLDGSDIGALFIAMVGLDHDRFALHQTAPNLALDRLVSLIGTYYTAGTLYANQLRMARIILFRFNALGENDYLPQLVDLLNHAHMGHIKHFLPSTHPRAKSLLTGIVNQLPMLVRANRLSSVFLINLLACCELLAPDLTPSVLPHGLTLLKERVANAGNLAPDSVLATTAQVYLAHSALRKSSTIKPKGELRIAACVSGQLRGYKEAFATWNHFGLRPQQVSYFVHTWANIGRKELFPAHAARCLCGAMLEAYNELYTALGQHEMRARYPSLHGLFGAQGAPVTPQDLHKTYPTEHIVVEDDGEERFRTFTNSAKMYYKIGAAHRLAEATGEEFDIFIRMRPDFGFTRMDLDWDVLQRTVMGTRKMITANNPFIYPNACAAMDDIIAFGDPASMDVYASTWEYAQEVFQGKAYLGFPHVFEGHETLFWSCFYRGVGAVNAQGMFENTFCDPEKPPASIIQNAVTRDVALRQADAFDLRLLDAARRDLG